jgi:hypothetical protein
MRRAERSRSCAEAWSSSIGSTTSSCISLAVPSAGVLPTNLTPCQAVGTPLARANAAAVNQISGGTTPSASRDVPSSPETIRPARSPDRSSSTLIVDSGQSNCSRPRPTTTTSSEPRSRSTSADRCQMSRRSIASRGCQGPTRPTRPTCDSRSGLDVIAPCTLVLRNKVGLASDGGDRVVAPVA